MIVTVGAPIILLLYSYVNFDFDREVHLINLEMVPVDSFERQARLTADPVQVNAFLASFNALRIRSALDLFLRVSMNLTFCYRLKRVIEVKIQQRRLAFSREIVASNVPSSQSHVPKWLAIPFVVFSCGLMVYTHRCTTMSRSACNTYPECVSHAHRITRNDRCPCLALFDIDKAPKTYEEWINPPDATHKVRFLASSGDLRVLQIINRKLMELPEELSRCTNLKHM